MEHGGFPSPHLCFRRISVLRPRAQLGAAFSSARKQRHFPQETPPAGLQEHGSEVVRTSSLSVEISPALPKQDVLAVSSALVPGAVPPTANAYRCVWEYILHISIYIQYRYTRTHTHTHRWCRPLQSRGAINSQIYKINRFSQNYLCLTLRNTTQPQTHPHSCTAAKPWGPKQPGCPCCPHLWTWSSLSKQPQSPFPGLVQGQHCRVGVSSHQPYRSDMELTMGKGQIKAAVSNTDSWLGFILFLWSSRYVFVKANFWTNAIILKHGDSMPIANKPANSAPVVWSQPPSPHLEHRHRLNS